jgi:PiT family inorganic phosphate transporter
MNPLLILVFVASALFAWSMGSHYTGAVMGTAYGSGVLSLRKAQVLAASAALVGSVVASINVIDTYANGLVPHVSSVDIASAQLAAAIVTTISTSFKLPTSTIQIYTFSLLGAALVGGLPIHDAGFGFVILFWVIGPLVAFGIGFILARLGLKIAGQGQRVLIWFVVVVSIYSSFTLGSNDVSNAASSLVALNLLPVRLAGLYGGFFMALGVLTWGRLLLERIGHDILKLDVPLAAVSQLSQALSLTIINGVGYNASINQTIVGGLTGSGFAVARNRLNWKVIRNIVLNWTVSPVLGLSCSALLAVILHVLFSS